jgi:hypothetical protein
MRIWTCDVCGMGGAWRDGSSAVYGSLLTEENGIPQFYTCSEACRLKASMPTDWRVKVEAHHLTKSQMAMFRKCMRAA